MATIIVPDHVTTDIGIMLLSIGFQMISEKSAVPTELHSLADLFNQLTEDEEGTPGDFFETIAQKPEFESVSDIIRNDSMVKVNSSFKDWN